MATYTPSQKPNKCRRTRYAGYWWRTKDELISDLKMWMYQSWPACKKLFTSALWGHKILLRRPVGSDGWWGWMEKESHRDSCCQHNLMMVMMMCLWKHLHACKCVCVCVCVCVCARWIQEYVFKYMCVCACMYACLCACEWMW